VSGVPHTRDKRRKMIDQSEIGRVVASVMDDIERDVENGELPSDVRIVRCMVVVESQHEDEDGDMLSRVTLRTTDNSNVIGLGLTARAHSALTE
jgi:hypothetical protein